MECEDVNAIIVGTNGRMKMYGELLKAFAGSPSETGKTKPLPGQKFKAIAAEHNRRWSKEKNK